MTNTAKYQCSSCTYSIDSKSSFMVHRAFCNGRINWRGHGSLMILAAVLILLFLHYLPAQAGQVAPDGRYPRVRSDGQICQPVTGGIQGMETIKNSAGTTYFTDSKDVDSPINLAANSSAALYDADGKPYTVLTFLNVDAVVFSKNITTTNADVSNPTDQVWSAAYPITAFANRIKITLPADHKSTSLCILLNQNTTPVTPMPTSTQTPTPTLTPTGTPPPPSPTSSPMPIQFSADLSLRINAAGDAHPTDIKPDPEPIKPAMYDGVIYVSVGSTVSMTVTVHNNSSSVVKDVSVSITGTHPYTQAIGTLDASEDAQFVYSATVEAGTNLDTAEVRSSAYDDSPFNNFDTVILNGYTCTDGKSMIDGSETEVNFCSTTVYQVYFSLIYR